MAPRLLPELIDDCIDFLHSDHRALSSCSLVCRNWLPATRYHLFSRIRITSMNVMSLIDLLESSSCTIFNHVDHIDFHVHVFSKPVLIVPYLERFVAVTTLTLRFTTYHLASFKQMEENIPRGSARFTKMDVTRIFSYGSYRELTFTLCDLGKTDSPPTFLLRLRSLHSAIDDESPELSCLLSTAQFPAITDIGLCPIKKRHLADIQAILNSRGPSIRSLDLNFIDYDSDMVEVCDLLDLSPITNLRSLTIHAFDFQASPGGIGTFSISNIVSRISSSSLTDIKISSWANSHADASRVDWEELADVLKRPQFSQLHKVSVHLLRHATSDESWKSLVFQSLGMVAVDNKWNLKVAY